MNECNNGPSNKSTMDCASGCGWHARENRGAECAHPCVSVQGGKFAEVPPIQEDHTCD